MRRFYERRPGIHQGCRTGRRGRAIGPGRPGTGLVVWYLGRSARERERVGGAATTEQPWGPDYKMSALSYVVSLIPPEIVRELDLVRHGYKIYPQNGYFVPYRDGRSLQLPDHDPKRRYAQIFRV